MIHSKGMHSYIHICGNSYAIIEEVPDTSLDMFSVDYIVDMGRAQEELRGRCALMGKINPVSIVWNGNPASIKEEAKRIMDAAAGDGRFVLAPGCETSIGTPLKNIIAMREAVEGYRY